MIVTFAVFSIISGVSKRSDRRFSSIGHSIT
jgi:hypothetical protein